MYCGSSGRFGSLVMRVALDGFEAAAYSGNGWLRPDTMINGRAAVI